MGTGLGALSLRGRRRRSNSVGQSGRGRSGTRRSRKARASAKEPWCGRPTVSMIPIRDELIIKYSKMERVRSVEEVQHPIVREALKLLNAPFSHLEIASMADIPAGTGLGSSGSFTTALLKALHTYRKHVIHPEELAIQACHIEIDRLGEPIGKQDQYIAAYGGIVCFTFRPNGKVEAHPLRIAADTLYALEDNLLLFFTGYSRSASDILREQDVKSRDHDKDMTANLDFIKEIGSESLKSLEAGDLRQFGELMNVHWDYKKRRSSSMTNTRIDEWYDGSSHKCVHDSAPAGRPRRGKRVRMRSCQLTSGEVVCRSVDGRLRGPRF